MTVVSSPLGISSLSSVAAVGTIGSADGSGVSLLPHAGSASNPTAATVTGWTPELDVPAGLTVGAGYNGTVTRTGNHVTVVNAYYNGTVAAGRYDAFFEFGLAPWDVAAGLLIVREAGGIVSDIAGQPYELGGPSVLASNFVLRDPMIEILSGT